MKIHTNYIGINSPGEINTEESVTARNQYMTIGEMVRRVSRGENLDVYDHTKDNPVDCEDVFDVLDRYNELEPQERERLRIKQEDENKALKQKIIDEYLASQQQNVADKNPAE